MRTKLLITTIFAMLLYSGTVALAQQGSDPSLWIEVRDENGIPLKNACVTLVPSEGDIVFRKADGKGRVRIKNLTRGRYRVTAKIEGYAAQKKEVLMGALAETVSFSLQPR
jgi:hypothetical protein